MVIPTRNTGTAKKLPLEITSRWDAGAAVPCRSLEEMRRGIVVKLWVT